MSKFLALPTSERKRHIDFSLVPLKANINNFWWVFYQNYDRTALPVWSNIFLLFVSLFLSNRTSFAKVSDLISSSVSSGKSPKMITLCVILRFRSISEVVTSMYSSNSILSILVILIMYFCSSEVVMILMQSLVLPIWFA
jgi:hypothetical protein